MKPESRKTEREIFEHNADELYLWLGDEIENRGTEVYDQSSYYFIYQRDDKDPFMNIFQTIKKIKKEIGFENLYAFKIDFRENGKKKSFLYNGLSGMRSSRAAFPPSRIFEMLKNDMIDMVVLVAPPRLIGYIDLSKYDCTYNSQLEFLKDISALKDESYEFDNDNIADLSEYTHTGDYDIVHGRHLVLKNHEYEFDGRCWECSYDALEYFWNNFSGEVFTEIDPDNHLTVYHRKGKDWYVVPSVNELEIDLKYCEETECLESEDGYCVKYDNIIIYEYSENSSLINRMLEKLSELKQEIEEMSEIDSN